MFQKYVREAIVTQFGEQDSWARVTESSPAKISAKSEFIVDDAPAVRGASGVNNR